MKKKKSKDKRCQGEYVGNLHVGRATMCDEARSLVDLYTKVSLRLVNLIFPFCRYLIIIIRVTAYDRR